MNIDNKTKKALMGVEQPEEKTEPTKWYNTNAARIGGGGSLLPDRMLNRRTPF